MGKGWHDLTAHLINKSSKGKFFFSFPPLRLRTRVFLSEVCARCKIGPWLQSKSMQNKQEMATIEEMRRLEGGEETDGDLDSQSAEERGNEFLAVKTEVGISRVRCRKKNGSKPWLGVVFLMLDRCKNSCVWFFYMPLLHVSVKMWQRSVSTTTSSCLSLTRH